LAERRARRAKAAPVLCERDDGQHYALTLGGAWHDGGLAGLRAALARATAQTRRIRVELLADCSLDSAALGLLLLLYGHQSKVGAALTVHAHDAALLRAMRLQNVDFLLQGLAEAGATAAELDAELPSPR
jgi:N-acetylglucosaminyldiphosphoundecaprenol N-acetyl-beta-D-mannosaminyltransferase